LLTSATVLTPQQEIGSSRQELYDRLLSNHRSNVYEWQRKCL